MLANCANCRAAKNAGPKNRRQLSPRGPKCRPADEDGRIGGGFPYGSRVPLRVVFLYTCFAKKKSALESCGSGAGLSGVQYAECRMSGKTSRVPIGG
ncbi:MAG: hypothetical protein OXU61_13790 [Gammaproteobacteria bacterium]|nr:hypothetical protein [Gammaproteobacteria bacterium]